MLADLFFVKAPKVITLPLRETAILSCSTFHFAVGVVIFLLGIFDDSACPQGARAWIISVCLAILNSLFLAASSLGLVEDVFGGGAGSPQNPS